MRAKKGFTLIELTLSIAFISVLLIGIATIVMRMTSIYQKGLALRAVNASGQQIIEDIQKAVNSASYIVDVTSVDSDGDGYISDTESRAAVKSYFFEATKKIEDKTYQRYGALCVSDYTYVWNTAEALKTNDAGVWINGTRYRFARIPDPGHLQCDESIDGTVANGGGDEIVNITVNATTDPVELINQDESDLAVYSFKITPATQSIRTKQAFLSASFIIATLRGGVNIMANGDYCTTLETTEYNSYDFDYCAVNKFNFSMRTGGNAGREG